VSLSGLVLNLAQSSGAGLLSRTSANSIGVVTLTGTADEIDVTNGTGDGANPTVGLADNPILPGTASVTLPKGNTAQRPVAQDGMLRFNTQTNQFEGVANGGWTSLSGYSGVLGIFRHFWLFRLRRIRIFWLRHIRVLRILRPLRLFRAIWIFWFVRI